MTLCRWWLTDGDLTQPGTQPAVRATHSSNKSPLMHNKSPLTHNKKTAGWQREERKAQVRSKVTQVPSTVASLWLQYLITLGPSFWLLDQSGLFKTLSQKGGREKQSQNSSKKHWPQRCEQQKRNPTQGRGGSSTAAKGTCPLSHRLSPSPRTRMVGGEWADSCPSSSMCTL